MQADSFSKQGKDLGPKAAGLVASQLWVELSSVFLLYAALELCLLPGPVKVGALELGVGNRVLVGETLSPGGPGGPCAESSYWAFL